MDNFKIAIVGGTGNLGSALVLRLGAPGVKIIIGSRDAEKAKRKGLPAPGTAGSDDAEKAAEAEPEAPKPAPRQQPKKQTMNPRSLGCVVCHAGSESMHADGDDELDIGCADCHGGDPKETQDKIKAHVQPRYLKAGTNTANIERLGALWNKESDEYIRFVNPGDFRAADLACGKCHEREVMWMKKSMMTHGGMLWGAALYNNGAFPMKDTVYGESYGKDGKIQMILTRPAPTLEETRKKGILPYLSPLPRWPARSWTCVRGSRNR